MSSRVILKINLHFNSVPGILHEYTVHQKYITVHDGLAWDYRVQNTVISGRPRLKETRYDSIKMSLTNLIPEINVALANDLFATMPDTEI